MADPGRMLSKLIIAWCLAAKVQLTQIRASRLRERVNLYLALGGDFEGTGAPK